MDPLLGAVLGLAMLVGGGLVFRHAEGLAGVGANEGSARGTGRQADGLALKVALNRAFALGAAVLGVATVLFFVL